MAYYNNYQGTFQPYYAPQPQYQMQQNQQQNQQSNSSIIWVQGEAGAKSYLVAPNTTVQLWDSESQVIYLKSADATGMPSIKIIDYTIRDNESQKADNLSEMQQNIRSELDSIKAEISALNRKYKALTKEGKQNE